MLKNKILVADGIEQPAFNEKELRNASIVFTTPFLIVFHRSLHTGAQKPGGWGAGAPLLA